MIKKLTPEGSRKIKRGIVMNINWLIASAIASTLSSIMARSYHAHSVTGFIVKNIAARGCSLIGTLISSVLFSGNVLSWGGLGVSIAIASMLILLIRGRLAGSMSGL